MTVAWSCEFCKGESGAKRASIGARRCQSNKKPWKCRDALQALRQLEKHKEKESTVQRGKRSMLTQSSAYAAIIAGKRCFTIVEVYGASFLDIDSISEDDSLLRNGIDEDDREYHYLVRGKFGDHKTDDLISGTRWGLLRELFQCCSATNLKKLDEFDAALVQEMKLAREDVVQQMQEDAEPQLDEDDE